MIVTVNLYRTKRARHWPKHLPGIIELIISNNPLRIDITPVLQIGKQSLDEIKEPG